MKTTAISSVIALGLIAGAAHAQEPRVLGTYGKWTAYELKGSKGSECYIASKPMDTEPKNVRRDPVHFLVTHKSMVNTIIGYNFKKGSTAGLEIDTTKFRMITDKDGAWLDTSTKDRQAVVAMKKGAKMIIRGTSWRGTKTRDTYSLEGVTAAMKAITDTCK
ncbi:MAG: invasion associated locus B family protein [Pseudomonadota bacterium]